MTDDTSRDNMGSSDLLRMTTEVVAAYLGNNSVPASQISEVISTVHDALKNLSSDAREPEPEPRHDPPPAQGSPAARGGFSRSSRRKRSATPRDFNTISFAVTTPAKNARRR